MRFAGAEIMDSGCDPGLCPSCQDECLEYAEDVTYPFWRGVYHVYRCPACSYVGGWFEAYWSVFSLITAKIVVSQAEDGISCEWMGEDVAAISDELLREFDGRYVTRDGIDLHLPNFSVRIVGFCDGHWLVTLR